jgi:hypothetical protein
MNFGRQIANRQTDLRIKARRFIAASWDRLHLNTLHIIRLAVKQKRNHAVSSLKGKQKDGKK